MKTYTLQITINEGNDEFWEALAGRSGIVELVEEIQTALAEHGWREPDTLVRLIGFKEAP